MAKLTTNIVVSQISANSKTDYVFDMHIAQKQNAKNMNIFAESLTDYFKQTQVNEFSILNGELDYIDQNHDSNLIVVTKVGLVYTITTPYSKVFSSALCYDNTGLLKPSDILVTFGSGGNDRTIIIITFLAINNDYRIVLT